MGTVDVKGRGIFYDVEETIFVAVGKSVKKSRNTIFWTLHNFAGKKISLLYVHQPIHKALTNGELATTEQKLCNMEALHEVDKQKVQEVFDQYDSLLVQEEVKVNKIWTALNNVEEGILEIIGDLHIRWLVRSNFLTSPSVCLESSSSMSGVLSPTAAPPLWFQKTLTLPPYKRGCHLITPKVVKEIGKELSSFNCGLAHFFLQHTSASLTINENYDSDVREDTETFLNRIVPEGRSAPWKHTMEGHDDMPAHIKSSMFGCSLTIPITNGKLNMGTWQGIWLCEHRDAPSSRSVVVTLNGI